MDYNNHQREFDKFHRGKFTASEFYKLTGERGGIANATAQTYILNKVAEELSDPDWVDDRYKGDAVDWGLRLEEEAREYYSLAFNVNVDKPDGQYAEWSNEVGCSPDGIAYPIDSKNYGIEFKCPFEGSNHVRHMLMANAKDLKSCKKEYYWQVVACMLIFGFDYYEFVSYDPRFVGKNRMFVLPIHLHEVQDDMKRLKDLLLQAVEEKHRIINLINQ